MKKSVSTAVAGVALALTTSSLALVMPATSANAVTAACTAATTAKNKAVTAKKKAVKAQKKAKKNATKAKKALKKKRTKATVKKVKLTKKKLVKANKSVKAANRRLTLSLSNQRRSCATTSSVVKPPVTTTPAKEQAQAEALAAVLKLLLVQMDKDRTDVSLLGVDGVKGLLNSVAPQLGTLVSDDILGTVVGLLKGPIGNFTTAAQDASEMFQAAFGQYLDPAALAGLASMTSFDPAAAAAMFTNMFEGLADTFGFAGSLPTFDPTMVTGFLAQLQNLANPGMLQGLGLSAFEGVFKDMISGKAPSFNVTQLTNLVNLASSMPGFGDLEDLTMLAGVLGGLTGGAGGLDAIPVLGPILKGLLCIIPLPILCS